MGNWNAKLSPEAIERITKSIEGVVIGIYNGAGEEPSMFIDLGEAERRTLLVRCVDWESLPAQHINKIVGRVLKDVREKVPDEIYPRKWFDGLVIGPSDKVVDFGEARHHLGGAARLLSLDDRVESPSPKKAKDRVFDRER